MGEGNSSDSRLRGFFAEHEGVGGGIRTGRGVAVSAGSDSGEATLRTDGGAVRGGQNQSLPRTASKRIIFAAIAADDDDLYSVVQGVSTKKKTFW